MRSSSPLLIQSSRSSDLDLNLKAHFTSPCFPWARFRRFQTAISGAEDGRRVNDVSQSLWALTPHSALWLRGEHVKHYLSNQHAGNNLVEQRFICRDLFKRHMHILRFSGTYSQWRRLQHPRSWRQLVHSVEQWRTHLGTQQYAVTPPSGGCRQQNCYH